MRAMEHSESLGRGTLLLSREHQQGQSALQIPAHLSKVVSSYAPRRAGPGAQVADSTGCYSCRWRDRYLRNLENTPRKETKKIRLLSSRFPQTFS